MPNMTNLIEEAVTDYWGNRCPDHEWGCDVCAAWNQYDTLCTAADRSTWTHRKKLEFDKAEQERIKRHEAAHKAAFNAYADELVTKMIDKGTDDA